jgi:hypothetical protein
MENLAALIRLLPEDYERDCFEQGAIKRLRGVKSPGDLMMLSLFHLASGCSLIEVSAMTKMLHMPIMSDVAFMKRFKQCGNWFKTINAKLMRESLIQYEKPTYLAGKRVKAVDASDVREKGRSGRIYRLHFSLDIFKMQSVEHNITDNKVGESLCNFKWEKGDLAIADRGYATIRGMQYVAASGAEFIVRTRKNAFTLRDEAGNKINLLEALSALGEDDTCDIVGFATNINQEKLPLRICARRKTPDALEKTAKRMKRAEQRRPYAISDEAKAFNEYIVVATNVDSSISANDILETYRLRWQVEIYFKRLKSILDFGEMPKRTPESVIAWLNGKIMVSLLIEIMIAKMSFPPEEFSTQKCLAGNETLDAYTANDTSCSK